MKRMMLFGAAMLLGILLQAEELTISGTLTKESKQNAKGNEMTSFVVETADYGKVSVRPKRKGAVTAEVLEAKVGQPVSLKVEAEVKENKKGKRLKVKDVLALVEGTAEVTPAAE